MRVPTENQYRKLLALGSGDAGLSWTKRVTKPLLHWGWVTAEGGDPYYHWVRLTPAGFAALGAAVERYGLPSLGPRPTTTRRVCSDCGSTRYRIETIDVESEAA